MAIPQFDGIFYVNKLPTVSYEDGLFHICHKLGRNTQFQFVMQPSMFAAVVVSGQEALAKWRVDQLGKVKPIRRRKANNAH